MKKILFSIFCFMIILTSTKALTATMDINCPSSASSLEVVECKIKLNAKDFKARGIQFKYEFTSGKYNSFINNNDYKVHSIKSNGAVLEKNNPSSGKSEIGTLKIEMPATGNAKFNIKDITITNDGDNTNIESVDINDKNVTIRVKSNVNTLSSLKVKEGNYLSNFDSNKSEYSFNYDKNSITFTGTLTDSSAKVNGLKSYDLKYGNNVINIEVISESGIRRVYKININRLDNRDKTNTLDTLTITDYKLNPEFNKNTTSYKLSVPSTTSKITINSTLTSNKSSYVGGYGNRTVDLKYGKNTILIKVKSESKVEKNYKIIVTREDNRSRNNYLKELSISSGEFKFNKKTTEYALTVKNEVESINVSGSTEDNKSKATGFGNYKLKEGVNTINIKVTAENDSSKNYVLKVTRIVKSNEVVPNNYLKSLSIKNYQINFDKDIVLYNITIENEKSLEFTYETESKDSSVIINGNENLKNGSVITLIVTAVDGSTREYKFNISKIEEVKKDEPIVPHDKVQISKTNIIKIVISCASIVVSIISLLILNIIRIIKKKAMLWK